ncbi:MAG: hypothetical protein MI923_24870, partial [Phycisphaerales bacterium]|nr:hypothetical protein [Phycisphaerales bacterium]
FLQQPTLAYEHDKANRMSKITGSGSYSGVSNPAYDKAGNQTFAYSSDSDSSLDTRPTAGRLLLLAWIKRGSRKNKSQSEFFCCSIITSRRCYSCP